MDVLLSLGGIIILMPVFVIIALLIKTDDGGPVFYMQTRVGQNGKLFRIIKFRTMVVNADQLGPLVTYGSDPRITRVGRRLRTLKLDELPQLLNVLMGHMSFVGPRPEVPEYVALYTQEQRRVLALRPGITDPASLKYRHESEILAAAPDPHVEYVTKIMPDKIRINCAYATRASMASDVLLIVLTVLASINPGYRIPNWLMDMLD